MEGPQNMWVETLGPEQPRWQLGDITRADAIQWIRTH